MVYMFFVQQFTVLWILIFRTKFSLDYVRTGWFMF